MRRFFEIIKYSPKGQWELDCPRNSNGDYFDYAPMLGGRKVAPAKFSDTQIPLIRSGNFEDVNFEPFGLPVVSRKIAKLLEQNCASDIQLVPTRVVGSRKRFDFVVVRRLINDGFDYKNSEYDHRGRNKKNVAGVINWKLKKSSVPGKVRVFRVAEWDPPIVVDGLIKEKLESSTAKGFAFREV